MGSRTAEFILGLIGSILGLFASILAFVIGGIGSAFEAEGSGMILWLGIGAFVFSIVGIIGAVFVRNQPKKGGIIMIVSAVGGLICISLFFAPSFILLLIAGLMGVFRKNKEEQK